MSDPIQDAARQWLQRFIDLYGSGDTGSPGDPIHSACSAAQSALSQGPTREDPYRVALMAAEALADDPRVAALTEEWHAAVLRAGDDNADAAGPIAG